MTGGVMVGNSDLIDVFSGNLAGDKPTGKYAQYIPSIGGTGCTAKIDFMRDTGGAT